MIEHKVPAGLGRPVEDRLKGLHGADAAHGLPAVAVIEQGDGVSPGDGGPEFNAAVFGGLTRVQGVVQTKQGNLVGLGVFPELGDPGLGVRAVVGVEKKDGRRVR